LIAITLEKLSHFSLINFPNPETKIKSGRVKLDGI